MRRTACAPFGHFEKARHSTLRRAGKEPPACPAARTGQPCLRGLPRTPPWGLPPPGRPAPVQRGAPPGEAFPAGQAKRRLSGVGRADCAVFNGPVALHKDMDQKGGIQAMRQPSGRGLLRRDAPRPSQRDTGRAAVQRAAALCKPHRCVRYALRRLFHAPAGPAHAAVWERHAARRAFPAGQAKPPLQNSPAYSHPARRGVQAKKSAGAAGAKIVLRAKMCYTILVCAAGTAERGAGPCASWGWTRAMPSWALARWNMRAARSAPCSTVLSPRGRTRALSSGWKKFMRI